ncbi:MAG: GspH/FimT family pseudopilin [Steroidobacteraceae bacterium]
MKIGRQNGFTLMELMITLALAGVILALAVPNMGVFIKNNRLTSAANDLLHSLQVARAEAIKRQGGNVVVCGTADPSVAAASLSCDNTSLKGWFVFVDTDGDWVHDAGEEVIETHDLVDSTVTVKADGARIVSYAATGFANAEDTYGVSPMATVVFCDARGNTAVGTDSTARAMFIATTGRAYISKLYVDVSKALNASHLNGTCP